MAPVPYRSCEAAHKPILTAKAFFISFGICVAAVFLICSVTLLAYIRRLFYLADVFWDKFEHALAETKAVINMAEKRPGIYAKRRDDVRGHFLYIFRHIKHLEKGGWMAHKSAWDDEGRYPQMLVDIEVITGKDPTGKETAPSKMQRPISSYLH